MRAHKLKVHVPESHELSLHLPEDFPAGEAEVVVFSGASRAPEKVEEDFGAWLERWLSTLPPAPTVPLEALDREHLYP